MAAETTDKAKQDKAKRIERDLGIITRFIEVFCREKHTAERACSQHGVEKTLGNPSKHALCADCRDLLAYATDRLNRCPMDPKPKCKDCPVHCYKPEYRGRMREVMKFSGIYFVKRGRVDWLIKYFS